MLKKQSNNKKASPKELHALFNKCFPNYYISQKNLWSKLNMKGCHFIVQKKSLLEGIAIVYKNSLLLLMVHPNFRNKGAGSNLLKESERFIEKQNHQVIFLGTGSDNYLFPGAPYNKEEYEFFEKRGYINYWDTPCLDLIKEKKHFSHNKILENNINNIKYEPLNKKEQKKLLKTVKLTQPQWTNYYEKTKSPIFVAKDNDQIVGFVIYEKRLPYPNTISKEAGGFSCLGVIEAYRKMGIAHNLVLICENKLIEDNVKCAFIGYTYLEKYYQKKGYRADKYYWMGKKTF